MKINRLYFCLIIKSFFSYRCKLATWALIGIVYVEKRGGHEDAFDWF